VSRSQPGSGPAHGHRPRPEARIALSALFTRFPDLRLAIEADEIDYTPSFITEDPLRLPVHIGRDAAGTGGRQKAGQRRVGHPV
jgi:hypothetical protein